MTHEHRKHDTGRRKYIPAYSCTLLTSGEREREREREREKEREREREVVNHLTPDQILYVLSHDWDFELIN